jgi:hypothetical protein
MVRNRRRDKAPPAVALIVVLGVEVKEASLASACWRFFRNAKEINIPSNGTLFYARVRLNVKPSAGGSRQRRCGRRAPIYDNVRGTRRQKNLLACL